jgi:hypothetical protein
MVYHLIPLASPIHQIRKSALLIGAHGGSLANAVYARHGTGAWAMAKMWINRLGKRHADCRSFMKKTPKIDCCIINSTNTIYIYIYYKTKKKLKTWIEHSKGLLGYPVATGFFVRLEWHEFARSLATVFLTGNAITPNFKPHIAG